VALTIKNCAVFGDTKTNPDYNKQFMKQKQVTENIKCSKHD